MKRRSWLTDVLRIVHGLRRVRGAGAQTPGTGGDSGRRGEYGQVSRAGVLFSSPPVLCLSLSIPLSLCVCRR